MSLSDVGNPPELQWHNLPLEVRYTILDELSKRPLPNHIQSQFKKVMYEKNNLKYATADEVRAMSEKKRDTDEPSLGCSSLFRSNEYLPNYIIEIAIRMAIKYYNGEPSVGDNVFTSAGFSLAIANLRGIEIGGYIVELILLHRPYIERLDVANTGKPDSHYRFHSEKYERYTEDRFV